MVDIGGCQLYDSQCCVLGWTSRWVGGVEVLHRMKGQGGGGGLLEMCL